MRGFVVLSLVVMPLAGCASILNPAPYLPSADTKAMGNTHYTPQSVLRFDNYQDAEDKMAFLAALYRADADKLRQQKVGFDLLAIGTGVGAVANSVGRGAQAATLALAGTSAASVGMSGYLGADTRISAYESGWSSLFCGANIADDLRNVNADQATRADKWLRDAIDAAEEKSKSSATTKTTDGAALAASVLTSAKKSLSGLDAAIAVLASGPRSLQNFTVQIEISITSKATTGIQNASATIAAAKAALSPGGSSASASQPKPAPEIPGQPTEPPFSTKSLGDLANQLGTLSTQADAISKDITDRMGKLADCAK